MASCDVLSARCAKSVFSLQHSFCDSLIGAAAAQVAAHAFAHAFRIIARVTFLKQADCAHDLAGRAEAALQAIVSQKGLLHRVKSMALGYTFNRQDMGAIVTDRQRKARIDSPSVDDDRAGAALAAVAALLCSCQFQALAKKIKQRDAGIIKVDGPRDAVHIQGC
jgi:hypothetical protein